MTLPNATSTLMDVVTDGHAVHLLKCFWCQDLFGRSEVYVLMADTEHGVGVAVHHRKVVRDEQQA